MDVGLIFGVIVAIILIGLIITFGYQQIVTIQQMQEMAEIARAKDDLAKAVDRVHSLSGETSEKFTLSFPGGVSKVCFLPAYRGDSIDAKKMKLSIDLRSVIEGDQKLKSELTDVLLAMRITGNPGGFGEIDKNLTLLIFFKTTNVPMFEYMSHLEPSKKTGISGPFVLCVKGNSRIWLQRRFDNHGAWVDVES
jgi:hypothetical protein